MCKMQVWVHLTGAGLTATNWLPCMRCIVRVILAIKPFVGEHYDRFPGPRTCAQAQIIRKECN